MVSPRQQRRWIHVHVEQIYKEEQIKMNSSFYNQRFTVINSIKKNLKAH